MWTTKELARCGKSFINGDLKLEDFCDDIDLGHDIYFFSIEGSIYFDISLKDVIKDQGTTYYNLKDAVFAPKVISLIS